MSWVNEAGTGRSGEWAVNDRYRVTDKLSSVIDPSWTRSGTLRLRSGRDAPATLPPNGQTPNRPEGVGGRTCGWPGPGWVARKRTDPMIAKLNLATTLAALLLFFLPWIDIQCSNQRLATQTGIQTIYGGGSPANEAEVKAVVKDEESLGASVWVGIALLAVMGAVVAAFMALSGAQGRAANAVGVCCAIALAALAIQAMAGFPVQTKVERGMTPTRRVEPVNPANPFQGMGAGMAAAMMMNVKIKYLPPFYLELLALGIPTLVWINRLLDRLRKAETTPRGGGDKLAGPG